MTPTKQILRSKTKKKPNHKGITKNYGFFDDFSLSVYSHRSINAVQSFNRWMIEFCVDLHQWSSGVVFCLFFDQIILFTENFKYTKNVNRIINGCDRDRKDLLEWNSSSLKDNSFNVLFPFCLLCAQLIFSMIENEYETDQKRKKKLLKIFIVLWHVSLNARFMCNTFQANKKKR